MNLHFLLLLDRLCQSVEPDHFLKLYTNIQSPDIDGNIQRDVRSIGTMPDISRFSNGVLLAQHRIEGIILDSLADYDNIEIQRGVEPISICYNAVEARYPDRYPVTIELAHVSKEEASKPASVLNRNKLVETHGKGKTGKRRGVSAHPPTQEIIRTKYVIGCDGAHSWTRRFLEIDMEGEQSEHIWAVLGKSLLKLGQVSKIRSLTLTN